MTTRDFYERNICILGLSRRGISSNRSIRNGEPASNLQPFICVHGVTRNRHDFDPLADYLSRSSRRHIFCPDLVGRGDSDWLKNPANYSYEQYLADMNVLISRTGQQEWIGWGPHRRHHRHGHGISVPTRLFVD